MLINFGRRSWPFLPLLQNHFPWKYQILKFSLKSSPTTNVALRIEPIFRSNHRIGPACLGWCTINQNRKIGRFFGLPTPPPERDRRIHCRPCTLPTGILQTGQYRWCTLPPMYTTNGDSTTSVQYRWCTLPTRTLPTGTLPTGTVQQYTLPPVYITDGDTTLYG